MFCINCGQQLPADAKFCPKCGKLQDGSARVAEPAWEICEIHNEWVDNQLIGGRVFAFLAKGVGPQGTCVFAQSPGFHLDYGGKMDSSLDSITGQLIREGWEYIGQYGLHNYEKRFRRKMTPERDAIEAAKRKEAKELLAYLRAGKGIKVEIPSRDHHELKVQGATLKPETQAKIISLKPQLIEILKQEKQRK